MEFLSTVAVPVSCVYVAIGPGPVHTYKGEFETYRDVLTKRNMEGYGIYFTPAKLAGTKRNKKNFVMSKVVWMDLDSPREPVFPLEPTVVVRTSPNKYHYYWRCSEHITDGEYLEEINRSIAQRHGGDPKTIDRTRLLRLPGFINQKNGFKVEVVSHNPQFTYSPGELSKSFPPVCKKTGEVVASGFDFESAVDDILSGEDIHGSRRGIAMHLANFGVPKDTPLGIINGLIKAGYNTGNIDKDRYTERMENNYQIVESAYAKIQTEDLEFEVPPMAHGTELPPPPPNLKVITDSILENMFYPNETIAIPIAFHLLGTFGGGRHSYAGVTASRKRTLCVPSGSGKDVCSQFVNDAIESIDHPLARHFRGNQSFAHRTVHMELLTFRCRSYVHSEAGQTGKSDLGDTYHTRAYMLQLLSAKVGRAVQSTATTAAHAQREKIPLMVKNPVVSILAEAPPETYAEVLLQTDAALSGDLSREELIFPDYKINETNWKGYSGPSEQAIEIFSCLANNFLDSADTAGEHIGNPFQPVEATCEQYFREYHNDVILPLRNEKDVAPMIAACYTRMFEKIKTTSLLLALLDACTPDLLGPVVINGNHFDYSVKYHEAIVSSIVSQIESKNGAFVGIPEKAYLVLLEAVIKYGQFKRDHNPLYSKDVSSRVVSVSWVSQVLKTGNQAFKTFCDSSFRGDTNRCRQAIIREAVSNDLIRPHPQGYKLSRPVQVGVKS